MIIQLVSIGNKLQYVASVGSGYQIPDEGPLLETSNLFLSPR